MHEFGIFALTATAVFSVICYLTRRRAPRLSSAFLGVAVTFGMITATEVALDLLPVGAPGVDVSFPDPYYTTDAKGILTPLPGSHRIFATLEKDGTVLYDVVCGIDSLGRREVPAGSGPYTRYCVFAGDSFTFGQGVTDEETFPAAYARLHPDVHVYNYGFHGSGPYDVLARLETADFAHEIAETTGSVVYTFIDEHVLRTRDFLHGARYRGKRLEYEADANGHLALCGTWATCHPLRHRMLRLLADSRIAKLIHLELPPSLTRRDFDRTANAIGQMDEVVHARCPNADFSVVFYPGCSLAPQLTPLLTQRGITCQDLSGAFPGLSPPWIIAVEDDHPNPAGYAEFARRLNIH